MKKITVRKRKLGREGALGLAWGHIENKKWTPSGKIEVDPRQSDQEEMDTVIHEIIHCEFPDLSEESVIRGAESITAVLWKLGFRKLK